MSKKSAPVELPAVIWPFATWDGERFVPPLERLTPAQRKEFLRPLKEASRTPDLSDVPEARF
jgi:hypothetical protein